MKNQPLAPQDGTSPKRVADTRRWLTRKEASDMLSCSAATLVNYDRRGTLHPQYAYRSDGRGHSVRQLIYDPAELAKLQPRVRRALARDPGEIAARAFEMFRDGQTLAEVVVALRSTPEAVEYLREKWLDMGGADLVINPVVKEELEKVVGVFASVVERNRPICDAGSMRTAARVTTGRVVARRADASGGLVCAG
jgi:hypothetical protein